jgi:hypothetical protein
MRGLGTINAYASRLQILIPDLAIIRTSLRTFADYATFTHWFLIEIGSWSGKLLRAFISLISLASLRKLLFPYRLS